MSQGCGCSIGRVYLAGPMRGYPDFNFPAFDAAAAFLRSLGHEVVNPAEMDRELDHFDPTRGTAKAEEFYMARDLPCVLACDAIALLPGWQKSSGANKELSVARWVGHPVIDALTGKPYRFQGGEINA